MGGGAARERHKFCHSYIFKVQFPGWIAVGREERVKRGGGGVGGREACNVTLWHLSRPEAC